MEKEQEILLGIKRALKWYNQPILELQVGKERIDSLKFELDDFYLKEVMQWYSSKYPKKTIDRTRIMWYALLFIWRRHTALLINHIKLSTTLNPEEMSMAMCIAREHMNLEFNKRDTLTGKIRLIHGFQQSEQLANIYYKLLQIL